MRRTENVHDLILVVKLDTSLNELGDLLDRALHSAGNLVDILGLNNSLQVVLENLGEVVY
jgi:hypothetical protein